MTRPRRHGGGADAVDAADAPAQEPCTPAGTPRDTLWLRGKSHEAEPLRAEPHYRTTFYTYTPNTHTHTTLGLARGSRLAKSPSYHHHPCQRRLAFEHHTCGGAVLAALAAGQWV